MGLVLINSLGQNVYAPMECKKLMGEQKRKYFFSQVFNKVNHTVKIIISYQLKLLQGGKDEDDKFYFKFYSHDITYLIPFKSFSHRQALFTM